MKQGERHAMEQWKKGESGVRKVTYPTLAIGKGKGLPW